MLIIVATNINASQPPQRRLTGTPTACAKRCIKDVELSYSDQKHRDWTLKTDTNDCFSLTLNLETSPRLELSESQLQDGVQDRVPDPESFCSVLNLKHL